MKNANHSQGSAALLQTQPKPSFIAGVIKQDITQGKSRRSGICMAAEPQFRTMPLLYTAPAFIIRSVSHISKIIINIFFSKKECNGLAKFPIAEIPAERDIGVSTHSWRFDSSAPAPIFMGVIINIAKKIYSFGGTALLMMLESIRKGNIDAFNGRRERKFEGIEANEMTQMKLKTEMTELEQTQNSGPIQQQEIAINYTDIAPAFYDYTLTGVLMEAKHSVGGQQLLTQEVAI